MPARQKGSAHSLLAKSRPRERDKLAAVADRGPRMIERALGIRQRVLFLPRKDMHSGGRAQATVNPGR